MKNIILLMLLFLFGCSVNQFSKDFYDYKKKLRHGLIPISRKAKTNKDYNIDLSPKTLSLGRAVYVKHCQICHGTEAKGDGPKANSFYPKPRDLVKVVKEVPNFKFYLSVSEWQNTMPGWTTPLTQDELKYVEAYLVSLAKQEDNKRK